MCLLGPRIEVALRTTVANLMFLAAVVQYVCLQWLICTGDLTTSVGQHVFWLGLHVCVLYVYGNYIDQHDTRSRLYQYPELR